MKAKWWTIDTIFVMSLGGMLAVFFATAFYARQVPRQGSALIPAATLQRLIEEGQRCQTITDDDVDNHTPRNPC
jgi:hypothetical protein